MTYIKELFCGPFKFPITYNEQSINCKKQPTQLLLVSIQTLNKRSQINTKHNEVDIKGVRCF